VKCHSFTNRWQTPANRFTGTKASNAISRITTCSTSVS